MDDFSDLLTEETAQAQMEAAMARIGPYPGGGEGRGIVIPGGGPVYFPCAWVCIRMLRHVGCRLPIELWHLGPQELPDKWRQLVAPHGVHCVDALEHRSHHPARRLGGWEMKPYAIIHSRFKEVILLDADNVCLRDPQWLFESDPYRETGAVFWPDSTVLPPEHVIWRLTGVPWRREPEFESGQMVVDKARCWKPLMLTMWMNEHSDFWYRFIYGDKDTFHLAWRKCEQYYAMQMIPFEPLNGTLCQLDFDGHRMFQHRHAPKWTINEANPRIKGFRHEAQCLAFLAELK